MNFIKHFCGAIDRFAEDDRITSFHISLYVTLFLAWNRNRFRNPVTISRDEVLRTSRIGSVNTYQKIMKQLHEWGYIRYIPSHSASIGSKVHLFRYDKTSVKTGSKAADKTGDNTGKKTRSKAGEKLVSPSINIQNNTNTTNKSNIENAYGTTDHSNSSFSGTTAPPADAKNTRPTNTRARGAAGALPNTLEEVMQYFQEKKSTAAEAQKYYDHYQSNGWKVSGRAPMKDWRAAARNWISNVPMFAARQTTNQPKPGKLNTGPKNYAEPY